jgi:hypothetical protein
MFDNDEFQRLNYKYGPFTLDACASAFDAKAGIPIKKRDSETRGSKTSVQ